MECVCQCGISFVTVLPRWSQFDAESSLRVYIYELMTVRVDMIRG